MSTHPGVVAGPRLDASVSIGKLPISMFLIIGGTVFAAAVVHKILACLDYPILSLPELLWNALVYSMPSSLIFGLRASTNKDVDTARQRASSLHAAKSEALRNVFKLDGSKILPSLRKSNPSGTPPGLGNWDNSCYQNSVLQALAAFSTLETFFHTVASELAIPCPDSTLASLQDFLKKLRDEANADTYLWTPPRLKSMSSWQQQDAQEYFAKLVDLIEKDVKSASRNARNLSAWGLAIEPSLQEPVELSSKGTMKASLNNPLEGLLAQRVGCQRCGFVEGLSLIPFCNLTLPLGKLMDYDIRDCLDEYMRLEAIEGVECAKCTLLRAQDTLRYLTGTLSRTVELDSGQESGANLSQFTQLQARMQKVDNALELNEFSEEALKSCDLPSNTRVCSTKSRQTVIMRPPRCLVLHVNRSVFDEATGALLKNYAHVRFPKRLDLSDWYAGARTSHGDLQPKDSVFEEWEMNPSTSMLANSEADVMAPKDNALPYELKAVITHQGRHENGHYICYRQVSASWTQIPDSGGIKEPEDDDFSSCRGSDGLQWWRFSDEDVRKMTEDDVLALGGAFMLFYEQSEKPPLPSTVLADEEPRSAATDETCSTSEIDEAVPLRDQTLMDETKIEVEDLSEDRPFEDTSSESVHSASGGSPTVATEASTPATTPRMEPIGESSIKSLPSGSLDDFEPQAM